LSQFWELTAKKSRTWR